MRSLSFEARALLALLLTVAFYALALGLVAGLGWVAWFSFTGLHGRGSLKLGFFAAIAALTILVGLIPRPQPFRPPGPRLLRSRQPRLFEFMDEVAHAVRQPATEEVYLIADVNAFVASVGGFLGIGKRRILALGLPLVDGLSENELRSVVAHEYGHYCGGDTRLGPLIYSTRSAVQRTVSNLSAAGGEGGVGWSLLRLPFLGYAKLYLRVTTAVSRGQEYAADDLAARVGGSRAAASALTKLEPLSQAWDAFFFGDLVPVLQGHALPPVLEGFRSVRRTLAGSQPAKASRSRPPDPYDTHPPTAQRVTAIERMARSALFDEADRPARALLDDVAGLEAALVQSVAGPALARALRPMAWVETGEGVFPRPWREISGALARVAPGLLARNVPSGLKEVIALGGRLGPRTSNRQESIARAVYALGAALGLRLREQGGRILNEPGLPLRVAGPAGVVNPFELVRERLEGRVADTEWAARLASLGVADAVLGDPALALAPAESA